MPINEPKWTKGSAAMLCLQGWDGYSETPVEVIGETPKRFRIKALSRTKLAGPSRWLYAGEVALVPKHAIRLSKALGEPR